MSSAYLRKEGKIGECWQRLAKDGWTGDVREIEFDERGERTVPPARAASLAHAHQSALRR